MLGPDYLLIYNQQFNLTKHYIFIVFYRLHLHNFHGLNFFEIFTIFPHNDTSEQHLPNTDEIYSSYQGCYLLLPHTSQYPTPLNKFEQVIYVVATTVPYFRVKVSTFLKIRICRYFDIVFALWQFRLGYTKDCKNRGN